MQIVPMQERHIPALVALENACFSQPWTAAGFAEELDNPLAVFLVAEQGGEAVGYLGFLAVLDEADITNVAVSPTHRRQGIAAALTSRLALEILAIGKVPFYCAAWCNLKSVRNAVKCGFRPAWVELTARDLAFVNEMNKRD